MKYMTCALMETPDGVQSQCQPLLTCIQYILENVTCNERTVVSLRPDTHLGPSMCAHLYWFYGPLIMLGQRDSHVLRHY